MRGHVLRDPGVWEVRTALAGTAADLVMAGALQYEPRCIERWGMQS